VVHGFAEWRIRLLRWLSCYPTETVTRFAVATHHNMLAQAKTFTRWCLKKRLMPRDPLASVEPTRMQDQAYVRPEAVQKGQQSAALLRLVK
jgi:hypothetical protein